MTTNSDLLNQVILFFIVLVISAFLVGCSSNASEYVTYNQQQGQQQNQYVGGGCGVTSDSDYDTPLLDSSSAAL